jgi:ribosomal protein S18 acetylase RimI-like enzyme
MVDFCVEEAKPEDASKIRAVQQLAFQSVAKLYGNFRIPPLQESQKEIETKIRSQLVLKATVEGEIVGSVRAEEKDGTCHVGRLIVHPKFQNQGLATQLLQEVERRFPSCHRFELFTGERILKTIQLYERLGYRIYKTEQLPGDVKMVFLEKTRLANGLSSKAPKN